MSVDSLPLVRASSVVSRHKTTFHTLTDKVDVEAPQTLMKDLIDLCDGTKQYESILDCLGTSWERASVKQLLQHLFQQGVLIDARLLVDDVWKAVENPMRFSMNVPEEDVPRMVREAQERQRSVAANQWYSPTQDTLGSLLTKRRSVRSFSGVAVSFQAVINLLWSAYGEYEHQEDDSPHRVVPSAGALYPLAVHVALFQETGDLAPSIYRVCYSQSGGVGFKRVSSDTNKFARAFLNPAGIQNGMHGVIVLSGSFPATGKKYGNRNMLYVPLEAGHAVQNVMLQGVEADVATLEIGGFIDSLLAEAINLEQDYRPLTVVAFGQEATEENGLPSSLQVDWAVPMSGTYRPPFAIASAKVYEKRSWSHGRDPSPAMALTKAIAEAKEWTAAGSVPDLVTASFGELDSVVDPREVIKFHPAQYRVKGFPFKPFDERKEYAWTLGTDYMTGDKVHILADHVYFPYFPETPYYCFSNSSGCAAHPDEQTAIETATLELIERDSFVSVYLGRITRPTVAEETLPADVRQRIADLRSVGFKVWIKDHTLDLAPVVLVFAQSDELTFSTCASASRFNPVNAIRHALMEVEASVLARLQNGKPYPVKPHEVGAPLDHGRLYGQKSHYRKADFLVDGGDVILLEDVGKDGARSWENLLDRFNSKGLRLLTVPLRLAEKHGGNGDLHIVRAVVPGLVQMTFGYRQEPAGMERIYTIAQRYGGFSPSYRELTKFPHPFE